MQLLFALLGLTMALAGLGVCSFIAAINYYANNDKDNPVLYFLLGGLSLCPLVTYLIVLIKNSTLPIL